MVLTIIVIIIINIGVIVCFAYYPEPEKEEEEEGKKWSFARRMTRLFLQYLAINLMSSMGELTDYAGSSKVSKWHIHDGQ